jgi:Flp pilus assembly protein TadD
VTHRSSFWACVIALAITLTYANTLSGPFIFDDRGSVLDNHTIESLQDAAVLAAPTETPTAGRPLANLTFALNFAFGGRDVVGYHVVNIALHVACALLVLGLVTRATSDLSSGVAVALLWGLHPLNSEVVNYITQRTESLMALWFLLTLYASVRALGRRGSGRWEAVAVLSCAAGMASKETMVVAPVVVLLYDRLVAFGSWSAAWRQRRRLYIGLASTWVVLAALAMTAPRTMSAGFTAHDADVWTYLLNQTMVIPHYLRLVVWPDALAVYYGWPLPLSLGEVWPQALFVVGLLGLTGVACVRWPKAGFLLACVFLTLAPTSSIIPITTEVGAERRMYLALIALVTLAVLAWRHSRLRSMQAVSVAAVALVTGAFTARTVDRNADYKSALTLAETALASWPSPAAHSVLGTELANAGRYVEAERHLREASATFPPAQYYLATVLDQQGQTEEAIMHFRAFIAGQPQGLDQVRLARGLLANIYMRRQQWAEATDQYRAMLAASPDDMQTLSMLANMLVRQQMFPEAIRHYERYLRQAPQDTQAIGGLAIALSSVGRLDEAIVLFQRVVALEPANERARANLDRALTLRGGK